MTKGDMQNKIDKLKDLHYDYSNRVWINVTYGFSRDETLFKLKSQIDILEKLLKDD